MQIAKMLLVLMIGSFAIAGCDSNDGPAEKAGETLDDAGDKIQDTAKDAGNAVEDTCEDMKENADAEDTDC